MTDINSKGKRVLLAASVVALASLALPAGAQVTAPANPSVGRGWPVPVDLGPYDGLPEEWFVGSTVAFFVHDAATAKGGAAPEGVEPLARDIFTSDDFYADRDLWSDPRYFRCNSMNALDSQWGNFTSAPEMIQNNDPATGAWGHCEIDYPREAVVSPYPFKTAQEHYEALLDETEASGGRAEPPADWNGRYIRNQGPVSTAIRAGRPAPVLPQEFAEPPQWLVGWANQASTIVSLLTEEYQTRFVQQMYHTARNNAAQWSLMFCRPEGFMRWWSGPGSPGNLDLTVQPGRVQFLGGLGNALRHAHVDRAFNMEGPVPRLGADVARWYGETVGFWDDDALITWTSNIQGWFTHGSFEHSSQMQAVEIWSARRNDAGELLGVQQETIFYDPLALVEPVRDVRFFHRQAGFDEALAVTWEYCNPTIFLGPDGRGSYVNPGEMAQFKVRDLFDRPWARIWEEFFEADMEGSVSTTGQGLFGF